MRSLNPHLDECFIVVDSDIASRGKVLYRGRFAKNIAIHKYMYIK